MFIGKCRKFIYGESFSVFIEPHAKGKKVTTVDDGWIMETKLIFRWIEFMAMGRGPNPNPNPIGLVNQRFEQ